MKTLASLRHGLGWGAWDFPGAQTLKPKPCGQCRPRGFTLLEVLVSLAIFALAAVVLGAAYVNVLTSYDAVSHRQEHEQDLRLVRAQVLVEPDREVVEKGGTFTLPDNRAAQWTASVTETAVGDLFQVAFRCEIPEPTRPQPWVSEEKFMLLRPTWSDAAAREKLRQAATQRLAKRPSP